MLRLALILIDRLLVRMLFGSVWTVVGVAMAYASASGLLLLLNTSGGSSAIHEYLARVSELIRPLSVLNSSFYDLLPIIGLFFGLACLVIGASLLASIARPILWANFAAALLNLTVAAVSLMALWGINSRLTSLTIVPRGDLGPVIAGLFSLLEQLDLRVNDAEILLIDWRLYVPAAILIIGAVALVYFAKDNRTTIMRAAALQPRNLCDICGVIKDDGMCPRHDRMRYAEAHLAFEPPSIDEDMPDHVRVLLRAPILLRFDPSVEHQTIGTAPDVDGRVPKWLHPILETINPVHAYVYFYPERADRSAAFEIRNNTRDSTLVCVDDTIVAGASHPVLDNGTRVTLGKAEFAFSYERVEE